MTESHPQSESPFCMKCESLVWPLAVRATVFLWFEVKFPSSPYPNLRVPPLRVFSQEKLHSEDEDIDSIVLINRERILLYFRVQAVFKNYFMVLFHRRGCQEALLNIRSRYFYDQYFSFVCPNTLPDVFSCTTEFLLPCLRPSTCCFVPQTLHNQTLLHFSFCSALRCYFSSHWWKSSNLDAPRKIQMLRKLVLVASLVVLLS